MTMSRRNLNKIKRRASILKASRRLFSRNGFEAANIDDIAEMAEVSRATLYNYFPNKESLLIGIAEDELENIRGIIRSELKDETRADVKLRRVLEVFVLDSIPYINLSRKITYLNSCEDSDLYSTRVGMMEIFRELAEEARQQGLFRDDVSTDDIVDIIMGVYLMAQYQWKNFAEYSEDYCREKLNRILDIQLKGIYA